MTPSRSQREVKRSVKQGYGVKNGHASTSQIPLSSSFPSISICGTFSSALGAHQSELDPAAVHSVPLKR